MQKRVIKWIRQHYSTIVNSIAFYPALIAIGFLLMSIVMLEIDFSEIGKSIKAHWKWMSLKDASTARTIAATIAGGIVSLTVFSFSMVMILLNQAASHMTNRMVDSLTGNRFQQVVLGFYIGTIVYALFLLSTIRDINSGIYVPALSIYLLILLTVVDIFMFIYFLHYVTQSIKFETIIHRIHSQTCDSLQKACEIRNQYPEQTRTPDVSDGGILMSATVSGYYQGFNREKLLELCQEEQIVIKFIHPIGSYLIKGTPMLRVYEQSTIDDVLKKKIWMYVDIYNGQPISVEPYYGFRQLTEIAIKALSPGINDPGTANLAIHALGDVLVNRLIHIPQESIPAEDGVARIFHTVRSFDYIFRETMYAIWQYGKDDRHIQADMQAIIKQILLHINEDNAEKEVIVPLLMDVEQTPACREVFK